MQPQDTAPQTTPQQPTNTAPPAPPAPPGKKFNPGKFIPKKFSLPLIIALVLVGGSAAAYFAVVVPKKPENVLKKAIVNTLKKRQVKTNGELKVEDSAAETEALKSFNIGFSTQSDADKKVSSATLEFVAKDIKLPFEFRTVDNNLYLKIGDANTLENISSMLDTEVAATINAFGAPLANKWIVIESELLKQSGTDCLLDSGTWNDADADAVANVYSKNKFVKVKNTAQESVAGRASTKMSLEVDQDKAKTFVKGLNDVPAFKKVNDCTNKFSQGQGLDSQLDKEANKGTYELNVWVDNSDKTFSKLELIGKDGESTATFTITFDYSGVSVEKPTDATPLTELLGDLAPLLGGYGGSGAPETEPSYPNEEL